jgi:dihydroflavonol-4-reductase
MRALVTGAAGFIGSHVVRALIAAGHQVRALHLPGEDLRNLRGIDAERVPGDVTDREGLVRAMARCDWVFHLAAIYALWSRDPCRIRAVNVGGTKQVLDAARLAGVQRVIHTSSIAVYGGQGRDRQATEQSPFALGATGDLYSRTKYEAHRLALAAARAGQDVVIVAPTGPIGPSDVGPTPTGRLLLAALRAPVVPITDTATCFADVRDMARGHLLAAERGRSGECYLLGTRDLELRELAAMILRIAGKKKPILAARGPLLERAARWSLGLAELTGRPPLLTPAAVRIAELGLRADCSKAVRELGLPQSPIEAALEDAISWFAREGYLGGPVWARRPKAARIRPG